MAWLVEYRVSRATARQYLGEGHPERVDKACEWYDWGLYETEYEARREAGFLNARSRLPEEVRVREVAEGRALNVEKGPVYLWNDPPPR